MKHLPQQYYISFHFFDSFLFIIQCGVNFIKNMRNIKFL